MLDTSLLQDPVFLLIGVSNMFGMAGLYVPFVYLVDAAKVEVCRRSKVGNSSNGVEKINGWVVFCREYRQLRLRI